MYEEMTIATSVQEVLNYPGLEYYHYKLMEYLKGRFALTTVYLGAIDELEDLPESTEEEPIQDGTIIFVSGSFVKDGNRYPNGATFIYNEDESEWKIVNPTNLAYDIVWNAIGDGMEYRKIFSIPEGASVILSCSATSGNRVFNDIILYSNNGENRVSSDLSTLKDDHLALFYDQYEDICVGTKIKIKEGAEYRFKILYSSCDPAEIVWYNTVENKIVTSETISKSNAVVLCGVGSKEIDKSSSYYSYVVADEDGNVDCDFHNYNQFTVDTSGVGEETGLVINTGDVVNPGMSYIIEVTDKVDGITVVNDGEEVVEDGESFYNGDKLIINVTTDEEGSPVFNYTIIRSGIISSNGSINVEKLSTGVYDITTTAIDLNSFEKVENKVSEVNAIAPSADKYVSEKGVVDFVSSGAVGVSKTRSTYEKFNYRQGHTCYLMDEISGDSIIYNAVYRMVNKQSTPDATGIFSVTIIKNALSAIEGNPIVDIRWISGCNTEYIRPHLTNINGKFNLYIIHTHPFDSDEWERYNSNYVSEIDTENRVMGVSLYLEEENLVSGEIVRKTEMGSVATVPVTLVGKGYNIGTNVIRHILVDGENVVNDYGIANIVLPEIPDTSVFQTVANKVERASDIVEGDTTKYPSVGAMTEYVYNAVAQQKQNSLAQEFALSNYQYDKEYYFVLGRIEPKGNTKLLPGEKIGNFTYQNDEKYVTETNSSFNEYNEGYGTISPNDGIEWSETVLIESDFCASGIYRFEAKDRGIPSNSVWCNVYYITNDNNSIFKPFCRYDAESNYAYYGFMVPAISEEAFLNKMKSVYKEKTTASLFKNLGARVYILENNLKYGRQYLVNKLSGEKNFVLKTSWNAVSYPLSGYVIENNIDNHIRDVQVEGIGSVVEENIATITIPSAPDLSEYQRKDMMLNEYDASKAHSQNYYPSVNYITNVMEDGKKELVKITAGNIAKGGLWNMIKVQGIDGQEESNGPKYKATFIVTGGDKNADYYGLCEVQFGYDRDKSPTNPAYKYCKAYWLGQTNGNIKPNGEIQLKIYTSRDYDALYICALTPAPGTYMNLEFIEEESTSANVQYLPENNITSLAPSLLPVNIGYLIESLTSEQLAEIKLKLED